MKIFILFSVLMTAALARAGMCQSSFTDFVGNADVFSIEDDGTVTVLDAARVVINEKRGKTQKVVITDENKKARTSFVIERNKGIVKSISKSYLGKTQTKKFGASCVEQQEAMDENTRTKIDAVEADSAR
jgi:hypothetical protein